jgi:hypothetical protein
MPLKLKKVQILGPLTLLASLHQGEPVSVNWQANLPSRGSDTPGPLILQKPGLIGSAIQMSLPLRCSRLVLFSKQELSKQKLDLFC